MDRISKLFVFGWAVAVLFVEAYYVSGTWPAVLPLTAGLFLVTAVATAVDRRAVALAVAIGYLVPAFAFVQTGRYHATFAIVWMAALLGAVTAGSLRKGWHVPPRWRPVLVCWAGCICLTAPIVVARAVDFRWELLFRGRLPTEALGGLPLLTVGWVLYVSLLLVVGILWFDWLCGFDRAFLTRYVAAPMAGSSVVLALVASYQLFVDVRFLNGSVYATLQRASATLEDANAAGAVASCWVGGWLMFIGAGRPRRLAGPIAMVILMWVAVWATGSRTALVSAFLITLLGVAPLGRGFRFTRRAVLSVGLLVVILAGIVTAVASAPQASGPIARFRVMLPTHDLRAVRALAREMWTRNGYGTAAVEAIRTYPLFGIGVGSFHEMASEFVPELPPDNAQNWYRHQLAELGLVGSLGWVVFVGVLGGAFVRAYRRDSTTATPLLGVLVTMAFISLLGMPGQDPSVAITLWTFTAWYLLATGGVAAETARGPRAPAWLWTAAVLVALTFAVGTTVLATGRLRLPARVARLDGSYLYGFYPPEPDGHGGEFRWARRQATAVVPVLGRIVELTLRTNRGGQAAQPLRVTASLNGRRVIDDALSADHDVVTRTVVLPLGQYRMLIDTTADSSVTAPPPDGRELAVMVTWRFLGEPVVEPVKLVNVDVTPRAVRIGTPVTFSAGAVGGSGSHEFRFDVYQEATASWTLLQEYGPGTRVTWTPTVAGLYWAQIKVRSVGSTNRYDAWQNTRVVRVFDSLPTP